MIPMTEEFILDLNLVYHIIRNVDRKDRRDNTSVQFFTRAINHCHQFTVFRYLRKQVPKILAEVRQEQSTIPTPNYDLFSKSWIYNKKKFIRCSLSSNLSSIKNYNSVNNIFDIRQEVAGKNNCFTSGCQCFN